MHSEVNEKTMLSKAGRMKINLLVYNVLILNIIYSVFNESLYVSLHYAPKAIPPFFGSSNNYSSNFLS